MTIGEAALLSKCIAAAVCTIGLGPHAEALQCRHEIKRHQPELMHQAGSKGPHR